MRREGSRQASLQVTCPCCGSLLTVDAALGQVVSHQPPPRPAKSRDLQDAAHLLEEEARRRDDLFRKSAEAEKAKSQLLDRKFEEALKKSKDQPLTPPLREIDLD